MLALALLLAGAAVAASPFGDEVTVDFGTVEVPEGALLVAAVYREDGKMLSVAAARVENGCAVASVARGHYESMARAKLFVLNGLTFVPAGREVSRRNGVSYSFYEASRKVMADEELENVEEYSVSLARNEAEGCQLVFCHGGEGDGNYTLSFSPFMDSSGYALRTEVFAEYYILCESDENYGVYPDALVPVSDGETFSFSDGANHPFYVKVWADEDAPAGTYTAVLTLADSGGSARTVSVEAQVWDFSLPDTPACTTAFGLSRQYIAEQHGVEAWSEEDQALYEAYYEFLLDHNISAYDLPYDILDERAEAYMSDPRVTSFCLPYFEEWQYGESADEYLTAYYERVQEDPAWADKAYFYVVDEPYTAEAYGVYREVVERLKALCPGYHMVMPVGSAEFEENGEVYNAVLMHAEGADIFCPLTPLMEDAMLREDVGIYLPEGRLWWYVCCGPSEDYCNVLTNMEGIRARLLLWQQKAFDVDGLLYWSTNFWYEGNPWDNGWTYRGSEEPDWSFQEFGDGSLLYPGKEVGIDGPVASLRLEILSDGIDDFDLLTLAETCLGRDYVEEMIARVSTSLTEYTLDDGLLVQVRREIGCALEAWYAAQ